MLVQPEIQHDLALRGDSISKGCACYTMLLTRYHYSSPVYRVVVLGGRIKGFSFCVLKKYTKVHLCTSCSTSIKLQLHALL